MRTFLAGMLCMVAATAQGQDPRCTSLQSEVTLGPFSGEKIDSVLIETAKPNVGRLGRLVSRLHVMTHRGVIQRELLFAPGDTVDTLMIAESLRRLRALAFLEYAHVEGRRCPSGTGPSLALTVVTRDAWTTRPDLKVGSASPRIGLTERNLFGTGRTVSLDIVSRNGSIGAGVTAFDSFGFGSGATARLQYQRYSDGSTRSLFLSRRQATVADRWRASFGVVDQVSEPRAPQSDNFERSSGELITGLRLTPRRSEHAIYLLGGIESEQGSLSAAPNSQLVGPLRIDRRFVGPQLGTAIVSTRYDTLTWLLAGGSVIDVPRTVEGEIVVGMGKGTVSATDSAGPAVIATSNFMTHYDAWLGREWLPNRGSRVVSDVWASGYSRSGEWHSGRLRATVLAEHAASNGVWRIFGASERLKDPDPDVRALGIYDRALARGVGFHVVPRANAPSPPGRRNTGARRFRFWSSLEAMGPILRRNKRRGDTRRGCERRRRRHRTFAISAARRPGNNSPGLWIPNSCQRYFSEASLQRQCCPVAGSCAAPRWERPVLTGISARSHQN